eukprot:8620155-Pyramimonas_sp.AAC.1
MAPGAVIGLETFLQAPAAPMPQQVYASSQVLGLFIPQTSYERMVRAPLKQGGSSFSNKADVTI